MAERARAGDVGAYEELVRRYQELAFRTAFVVTGSAAEAEDAAQDAFVKAYYALGRFRTGAPFRPWLLRIVVNEARNRRASAWRRHGLAERLAAGGPEPAGDNPEAAMLTRERRETLLRALGRLSGEDRMVIAYRYFLDLSEAETAAALGRPRGTVKSRLSRALARLRAALNSDETRPSSAVEPGPPEAVHE